MSSHIVRDQDALRLVYPLADFLGVRLGLRHIPSQGYEIVRIPTDKGVPFKVGPVSLNLPLEIKASYCIPPVGAIWVKLLRSMYLYIVVDTVHSMTYCHVVDCSKLGADTKELHAKFKGSHPFRVLDDLAEAGALIRAYARGRNGDQWHNWGRYGEFPNPDTEKPSEDNSVDTGPVQADIESLGQDPGFGEDPVPNSQ